MPPSRTHGQNRSHVCLICFTKPLKAELNKNIWVIQGVQLQRVHKYFMSNFDPNDQKYPNGICTCCKSKLLKIENADKKAEKENVELDPSTLPSLPDLVDYPSLNFPRVGTRSSGVAELKDLTNCPCEICKVALANPSQVGHSFGGQNKTGPHQIGRPPNPEPKPNTLPLAKPVTICSRCRQLIGKGISHPQPCTLTDRRENITNEVNQDQRLKETIAANVVKDKVSQAGDGDKFIELATPSGRTLKVAITKSDRDRVAKYYGDKPIPASELKKLMIHNKMTFRAMERDAQFYRAMKGRDFYESGALDILKTELESMKHFYKLRYYTFDAKLKKDGQKRLPIVYCENIKTVIEYLKECRGYKQSTKYMIKVGGDEGQNVLKLAINLIKESADDQPAASPVLNKTFSYSTGPFSASFKGSGVNLTIIVAAVPAASETIHNFKIIWDLVKLNSIRYYPALDMKFKLLALGLGTAASTYPCPYCKVKKVHFESRLFDGKLEELRTFKEITEKAKEYQQHAAAHQGTEKLSSADWHNCEHEPLLMPAGTSPEDTVLSVVPPSELHYVLGIVNKLYDLLDERLKENDCSITAESWSKPLNCPRSEHHGGQFNGEQCVKLLENTKALNALLKTANAMSVGGRIGKALEEFNAVRKSCFGQTCSPFYKIDIENFAHAWLNAKAPIIVKVHCTVVHVPQFLDMHPEKGLGWWSEQATEHIHSDLENFFARCKYHRNLDHPEFPNSFLKAIVSYCSLHEGDDTSE